MLNNKKNWRKEVIWSLVFVILFLTLDVAFIIGDFGVALGLMISFIEDGCEPGLDFGDFLLFFLFKFFMDAGHVLGGSFLFHFLEPSQGLKVLFLGHFSGVNISHNIFFVFL